MCNGKLVSTCCSRSERNVEPGDFPCGRKLWPPWRLQTGRSGPWGGGGVRMLKALKCMVLVRSVYENRGITSREGRRAGRNLCHAAHILTQVGKVIRPVQSHNGQVGPVE